MISYNQSLLEFKNLFPTVNVESWGHCYATTQSPLSAYTVFKTYEAANTFIHGYYDDEDEKYKYETYQGMLISVVGDPSSAIQDPSSINNNDPSPIIDDSSTWGLYQVVFSGEENPSTHENRYELVKLLYENDSVSGDVKVERKTSSDETNPYIYFVGVDSSTSPQDASTFYFNPGIVYDANGGMIVTESDIRLKDINTHLDVDVDSLVELDKVYFSWKDDPNHKQCIGVTAQSVEKRFPELVVNNPDTGYKMVNYAGLSVIALAAIDKLNERYQILENRLNDLENKINNINR